MNENSQLNKLVIVTDKRFLFPVEGNAYIDQVLLEDALLTEALQDKGFTVDRINWDNPTYDWSLADGVIIRAVWDYHYDIHKFNTWLNLVEKKSRLINSKTIIDWNFNKSYLLDLEASHIPVVPTHIVKSKEALSSIATQHKWHNVVVKPTVSAGGKDTFLVKSNEIGEFEETFKNLCAKQEMMVQPFIPSILSEGEVTLVVLNGKYSHAIKKKAKEGEFRVQDDFGGSVHAYEPSTELIQFAEQVFEQMPFDPVYGRVDLIKDEDRWLVSELELIEPELWFRNKKGSANLFAEGVKRFLSTRNQKQCE